MKHWLLLALVLLSGCSDSFVESDMLIKATEVCAPNGGLQTIRVDFRYRNGAWVEGTCKNKVEYRFAIGRP